MSPAWPMQRPAASRLALAATVLLSLLLGGCTEEHFLQPGATADAIERPFLGHEEHVKSSPAGQPAPDACPVCPTSPAPSPENGAKPQPPLPRTLPQALCAYFRCLCYGPPPSTNGASVSQTGQKEQSKNPPAEERTTKNGQPKGSEKQGNGKPEQSKNPPTEKAGEDKDKEAAKENGNGKEGEKENGKDKEAEKEPRTDWYSAHAQATVVTQAHDAFRSPYLGPLSLLPHEPSATSITGTVFLDARLWDCDGYTGEVVFNPEIAGGRGFSGTDGIAGFPNGEITRVGTPEPTPYIARLYLRQTIGFGGEQETVEEGPNQITGKVDVNRLTLTMGKFSATDLVDNNSYSHDPRTQFLPWSIMYNGAWDYPANVRGYTYGLGLDLNEKTWALRYGIFQEPRFANGAPLDPHILKANGQVVEWEGRYQVHEHPGRLRLLAYLNLARMGDYSEALAAMPIRPDVTATRSYRAKYGFGLNWEQELTKQLGVFARLGWNDGHTESWAFTAIDRLAETGLLLKGKCWCRPNDQVGLALAANGIAKEHRDYLAAGGLDFIIGDGTLRYGPEEIVEIFYNLALIKGIFVTVDFQEVVNPAYNRDRGPVSIGSLRVHYEF